MKEYYDSIFKRRSMRKFDDKLKLSESELQTVRGWLTELVPLSDDIGVLYEIVKREDTNCKFGEYCLLVFSEPKSGYLRNAGYLVEQFDLKCASENIGGCWYGFGKYKNKLPKGMVFVIMYAFGKCTEEQFRSVSEKPNRKSLDEVWIGDLAITAAGDSLLAPSACNSQPWRVLCVGLNDLNVCRSKDIKHLLASRLKKYFNKIDIGIYMCILEVTLKHYGFDFSRRLVEENEDLELIPNAVYTLQY